MLFILGVLALLPVAALVVVYERARQGAEWVEGFAAPYVAPM